MACFLVKRLYTRRETCLLLVSAQTTLVDCLPSACTGQRRLPLDMAVQLGISACRCQAMQEGDMSRRLAKLLAGPAGVAGPQLNSESGTGAAI